MKFSEQSYGKPNFRHEMSQMTYPMKVECVIDMQERVMPICARRGEIVKPWRRDSLDIKSDEQARFCSRLCDMVPQDILCACENALIACRESYEPKIYNVHVGESTNAY